MSFLFTVTSRLRVSPVSSCSLKVKCLRSVAHIFLLDRVILMCCTLKKKKNKLIGLSALDVCQDYDSSGWNNPSVTRPNERGGMSIVMWKEGEQERGIRKETGRESHSARGSAWSFLHTHTQVLPLFLSSLLCLTHCGILHILLSSFMRNNKLILLTHSNVFRLHRPQLPFSQCNGATNSFLLRFHTHTHTRLIFTSLPPKA